jgi:hypothetical protein
VPEFGVVPPNAALIVTTGIGVVPSAFGVVVASKALVVTALGVVSPTGVVTAALVVPAATVVDLSSLGLVVDEEEDSQGSNSQFLAGLRYTKTEDPGQA